MSSLYSAPPRHHPSRHSILQSLGTGFGLRMTEELPGPEPSEVTAPDATPHVSIWKPTLLQRLAMQSRVNEQFFGGARGGGKSDMLIADFDGHAESYRKQAIGLLLRRTYPEHRPLLNKARKMFLGKAQWHATDKVWNFHNGAKLYMGPCETIADVSQYMGSEYTWMGFDELPEWPTMEVYEFMGSCMRSTGEVPKLRRSTGNPGRAGHGWVKAYFIDVAKYGEVYVDPETGRSRQFIPAKLDDNPHLMHNLDYVNELKALNPILRRAFLDGDWDVFLGQAFPEWNRDLHVIPATTWMDPSWPKWASLDWGTNKPYGMLFFTATPSGHVWLYREAYGQKADAKTYNVGTHESAPEIAEREWRNCYGTNCTECVFDSSMDADHGHGVTLAEHFRKAGWTMYPSIRNRLNGKAAVHAWLQTQLPDKYPVLQIFEENCPHLIRTLPALPYATTGRNKNEDVDSDAEDHLYDALQYSAASNLAHGMILRNDAGADALAARDAEQNAWSVSDQTWHGEGWQKRHS